MSDVRHVGFVMPPGGSIGSDFHVLQDHTYCCQLGFDVCDKTGEPAPEMIDQCWAFHVKRHRVRSEDARRLGVPFYMGEFGACGNS